MIKDRLSQASSYTMPKPKPLEKLFLTKETPENIRDVDRLIAKSFDRTIKKRPVYGFRTNQSKMNALCRVALDAQGCVQGAIRYYRAHLVTDSGHTIDCQPILLGPLSVSRAYRGKGLARQLITYTLGEAHARGFGPCFVVGDPKLYRQHGFCNATSLMLHLDKQEDLRRFLVCELKSGQITTAMQAASLIPAL